MARSTKDVLLVLTGSDWQRFFAKVDMTGECWEWTAGLTAKGYGKFAIGGTNARAHRVAWASFVGDLEDGMTIDHLCRNRKCVRPDHLEQITNAENILRGDSPSARYARAVACLHGHPFDETNTHIDRKGWRVCRQCNRDRLERVRQGAIA